MKKYALMIILLVVIIILGIFIYLYIGNKDSSSENPTKNLKISILDIGKADSILLNIDDKNVLIDTGEDNNGQEILSYLRKNNVEKLDYMIITHFDKDHVGGADIILDNMDVTNVIQPLYEKNSKQYTQYINSLKKKNLTPITLKETMSFNLNGAKFTIYPPNKTKYKEGDNDFSLVTSVIHGSNSFLFTGDAESERLQELLNSISLKHTFLKVPHHGKYSTSSKEFFTAVSPKYAAITCSKKKPADEKILSILDALKVKTYQTVNGNIIVTSNGSSIDIKQ